MPRTPVESSPSALVARQAPPGPPPRAEALCCMVLTTSDSRTLDNDAGGAYAMRALQACGNKVVARHIVADEVDAIRAMVLDAVESGTVDILVITGGTSLGPRDVTPDAVVPLFTKHLPGFGEALRHLAFRAIGPTAILTRACAGVISRTLVFILPGPPASVTLAMDELVIPVIDEAATQLGRPGSQAAAESQ